MPRITFDSDGEGEEEQVKVNVVDNKRKSFEKKVENNYNGPNKKSKFSNDEREDNNNYNKNKFDHNNNKNNNNNKTNKFDNNNSNKNNQSNNNNKNNDENNNEKKEKQKQNDESNKMNVEAWREANNVSADKKDCPDPYQSFDDAPFPDYIAKAIQSMKFDKPTPIQAQSWPLAMQGRDMIGLAETGSGKTLAFIFPAIIHIMNLTEEQREKGPSVLVLAPTRELAQQIQEVSAQACIPSQIKSCCVYGGDDIQKQIRQLEGAEIIVATPGRLIDLLERENTHMENISFLVLDEADRMLDMGFEIQVNQIISRMVLPRQTMMFSATWPPGVQRLASKFFKNPTRITVGSESLSGAKKVTQVVQVCDPKERIRRFKELLNQLFKNDCRILVFMLYTKTCEEMHRKLLQEGWPVGALHGKKPQSIRNSVLESFKTGETPILIATDVASRGLDIKNVKYVINVEFPLTCEDYVHRIGRTGRAGEVGTAYTLFTPDDKAHARELVQILQESNQNVPPALSAIAEKAPGIKPKKNIYQEMYGDFASSDAELLKMKPKRVVFGDD